MAAFLPFQPAARGDDLSELGRLEEEYLRTFANADYDQAERAARGGLEIILRLNPATRFVNLQRIGSCRNGLGFYQESIDYCTEAIALAKKYRPTTDAERSLVVAAVNNSLMNLGECYYHLGRRDEAIDSLQQAIAWNRANLNDPYQFAKANLVLVMVYQGTDERQKIEELFRENLAALEPLAAKEAKPGIAADFLALTLSNWAILLDEEGRLDLAEPKLRRALALHVSIYGWDHSTTAGTATALAVNYFKHQRIAEAEPLLRAALAANERQLGAEHPYTLSTLGNLALTLQRRGEYAEAETLFRRTVAGLEKRLGPDSAGLTNPLSLHAACLARMGRDEEAAPLFERAIAISRQQLGQAHRETSLALFWLAYFKHSELHRHEEAASLADELFENHAQNPLPSWMIGFLHAMRAARTWDRGEKQAAIDELKLSIEEAEATRWFSAGAERERAAASERTLENYETMVEWQAESQDSEAVFRAIEAMNARTFLDELEMNRVDFLAGLSAADRQSAEELEQALRTAVTKAHYELSALPETNDDRTPEAIERRRAMGGKLLQAQQHLYEHLARVRSESDAYRQLMGGERDAITLAQAQETLLGDEDLMLLYSVGWEKSYVMAIRRGETRVAALAVDEAAAAALGVEPGPLTEAKLVQVLQTPQAGVLSKLSSPKRGHEAVAALAALWQVLIPAEEREALVHGRFDLLTVVPDGPLALLPFETLVVGQEKPVRYLLDAGPPIAYAPSASVLVHLAKRSSKITAAAEPVLCLGDPAYPTTSTGGRLSRLPFSGVEASWVKQLFEQAETPAKKLAGAEATEAMLRRSIAGRTILHLACHGAADANYGNFFGGLALAPGRVSQARDPRDDGFLTMSEIAELDLQGCELAILSACQTNFGPEQRGEGVWTLSRGFLVAGARRVIASNWVVDDQAGATLVSYFVREITRGGKVAVDRNYAQALREAKMQLRKQEKWAAPFYWSSLVLVGPK